MIKTSRGVYLNLTKSPFIYDFKGHILSFSSKKKLEIFSREIEKHIKIGEKNSQKLYGCSLNEDDKLKIYINFCDKVNKGLFKR